MKTQWKLFLDDIRTPDSDCILAISVNEAIDLINKKGFPVFISFDHDLGEDVPSGKDFVNTICDKVLDEEWEIPKNFTFQVHSDNTVGAENIRSKLNQFLEFRGIPFQLEKSQPYSSRIN